MIDQNSIRAPWRMVSWVGALTLAVGLCAPIFGAQAHDESKYPNFGGQWKRPPGIGNQFDQTKAPREAQKVEFTPEYQKIFEDNLKDQALGGQGTDPTYQCIPDGMPRAMNVIFPLEIIVTPNTTYMLIEYLTMQRRIFTDGRSFPEEFPPSYMGYSIGKWIDEDGDGKYDVLEIETRHLEGPRSLDPAGTPVHDDNNSIVTERISFDKADPARLNNEITLIDNALTRPWTVLKQYRRVTEKYPDWPEDSCDNEGLFKVGKETYFKSGDGSIMPTSKDQPPPDLRYFPQSQNRQ